MGLTTQLVFPSKPVPSLARFGASPGADLIYRTLSAFGAQSVNALSRSLSLPSTQVIKALDELDAYGAASLKQASRQPGDRVWQASPTDTVVATLRNRQAEQAMARRLHQRSLSQLDIVGLDLDDLRLARPLNGMPAVRSRLMELVAAERLEHLAMSPEVAFTADNAKASAPSARAMLSRGVSTLNLSVPSGVQDESDPHTADLYAYNGLEYRELPQQPIKLMVMDRATAFLPLDPSANFTGGVWEISDPAVVEQLVNFFMQHWDRARTPAAQWLPPPALSVREKAVVLALSNSGNDAEVAERLQLSERTISATVKNMMERYNAQTRFQLGLALGMQQKDGEK